ncbi:MAG: WecB/TagA/CpsF family glycosyltransferase [Clostridia bacterium]|nr:WecB/TagA/CpsF family glycosyltransferase [Clostridia bacterium]MBQ7897768.1 WecB/TagA/CpsF family glycosyltransferase [Clostridia bacterium]
MEKINIRGVLFDNVTPSEAIEVAEGYIERGEQCVVFTPNAEIVQMAIEDDSFRDVINSAELVIPDGAGVVLASRILKKPLKGKVAGCEFAESLVKGSADGKYKIFFYGSKPATDEGISVADLADRKMGEKYGFKAAGTSHGYVKPEGYAELIEKINSSGADILFVCLGVPMQEKWIYQNRDKLNAKLIIGLGGTLDVFAGTVKRAPRVFVKLNLEWFYRLIKEPKRLGRMMKLPKFIFGTLFSKKEK